MTTPTSGYTTIVVTPHQDDEMRLVGYLVRAAARGDRIVPVCVTDGSSTVIRERLGLTRPQITRWRDREQWNSFDWLTEGSASPTIKMGLLDGASQASSIRTQLENIIDHYEAYADSTVEVYVCTWHHDRPESVASDQNHDHVQTILAVREIAARRPNLIFRFARHYTMTHLGGTGYAPENSHQMHLIEGAVASYAVIGHRSAPEAFQMVLDKGGYSKVTK